MKTHSRTRGAKSRKKRIAEEDVDLGEFYPVRSGDVRKGNFGRVVVSGGSDRYAGCLAFNSLAALRAGADLAIVVSPRRAADIVAGYSPDLITVPCDSPFPDPDITLELLKNADSLVLGCGVARTAEAHRALTQIVRKCTTPIVLDAEAIHAVSSDPDLLTGKRALLTPNAGEYEVLSRNPWPKTQGERKIAVQKLAKRYRATVIVKGAVDFISDGERVYLDTAGSAYMTKGGYGDLLAGVAGAHLARGRDPFDAARAAAFIVGKAGELASAKSGESTLTSDVLSYLSSVIPLRRKSR